MSAIRIQRPTKGFTLIELLVVIAIIALLAAILFPVFARARENARKSACLNNMKQIGVGIMQYKQDFDEFFPQMYWSTAVVPTGRWEPLAEGLWGGEIMPYVKSRQIFICPSTRDTTCSYIYNGYLNGRSDADLAKPAEVIVTGDSTANGWWALDSQTFATYGHANCRLKARHLDEANFAYGDGHAKWVTGTQWKPSQWTPTWTP